MSSLNRCEFIGNVGKDPEVRSLQNGDKVANLSIAVTEKWKDKNSGEPREKTEWVRINFWAGLAGVVDQYVHKGDKIFVAGKMETRSYKDNAGVEKYVTEIRAEQLVLLGSPGGRSDQGGGARDQGRSGNGGSAQRGGQHAPNDDIPF